MIWSEMLLLVSLVRPLLNWFEENITVNEISWSIGMGGGVVIMMIMMVMMRDVIVVWNHWRWIVHWSWS